jgi:hypothetical protein
MIKAVNDYIKKHDAYKIDDKTSTGFKNTLTESLILLGFVLSFYLIFVYFPTTTFYEQYAFTKGLFSGEDVYSVLPLSAFVSLLFLMLHILLSKANRPLFIAYLLSSLLVSVFISISVITVAQVCSAFFDETYTFSSMRIMVILAGVASRFIILGPLKKTKLFSSFD